jgi:YD repeat-containing protein
VPEKTVYATTTTYDALGRALTQSSPDAQAPGGVATVSYAYNGLSVTVTNPKGQTKTTIKNVAGQTAQVIDHDGNQVLYSYDALGSRVRHQVTQVVDSYRSPFFFTTTTGSVVRF